MSFIWNANQVPSLSGSLSLNAFGTYDPDIMHFCINAIFPLHHIDITR